MELVWKVIAALAAIATIIGVGYNIAINHHPRDPYVAKSPTAPTLSKPDCPVVAGKWHALDPETAQKNTNVSDMTLSQVGCEVDGQYFNTKDVETVDHIRKTKVNGEANVITTSRSCTGREFAGKLVYIESLDQLQLNKMTITRGCLPSDKNFAGDIIDFVRVP